MIKPLHVKQGRAGLKSRRRRGSGARGIITRSSCARPKRSIDRGINKRKRRTRKLGRSDAHCSGGGGERRTRARGEHRTLPALADREWSCCLLRLLPLYALCRVDLDGGMRGAQQSRFARRRPADRAIRVATDACLSPRLPTAIIIPSSVLSFFLS